MPTQAEITATVDDSPVHYVENAVTATGYDGPVPVSITTADVQSVIDALVALGLVTDDV